MILTNIKLTRKGALKKKDDEKGRVSVGESMLMTSSSRKRKEILDDNDDDEEEKTRG